MNVCAVKGTLSGISQVSSGQAVLQMSYKQLLVFRAFWVSDVHQGFYICVLCTMCDYSTMVGAFWGPRGVDFHVGVQLSLGAHGCGTGRKMPATLPAPVHLPADSSYLRQEAEISVQNGIVGVIEEFQEVGRQEMECIGHGQLRKKFLLLCLVVQDFCLRVTAGKKSGRFRRLLWPYLPSQIPNAIKPYKRTVFISHYKT